MNEKNVLVSLTLDEAKLVIDALESKILSLDVPSDALKTAIKSINKFYDAMEYAEKN